MQADKSPWLIRVSTIGVHPKKGLKSFPQLLLHRQNSCLVLVDHKHEFQRRKLALFLWGHSGIQGFSWQKRFLVCHLSFLTKSLQIPIPLLLAGTLSPELSSGASLGGSRRSLCRERVFGNDLGGITSGGAAGEVSCPSWQDWN